MLNGDRSRSAMPIAAALLTALLLSCAGCLISSSSSQRTTGNYVSDTTFSQIQPGQTTVGWVQATLGEPTSKADADDHVIWTYSYVEHKDSSGAVFLIFGAASSTETPHKAYVEFKDGVVVNKWRN